MTSNNDLKIRVTPKASKNKIVLADDGSTKAYVTAPPVEGEANKAVCELLAKVLSIPKSSVWVVAGHSSRDKTLRFETLDSESVHNKLVELLSQKKLPGL